MLDIIQLPRVKILSCMQVIYSHFSGFGYDKNVLQVFKWFKLIHELKTKRFRLQKFCASIFFFAPILQYLLLNLFY